MNVICFTPSDEQLKNVSCSVLDSLTENDQIEIHKSHKSFNLRLKQPLALDSVLILCPQTMEQLDSLIACREFFHLVRIILVLPHKPNGMLDSVHVLSPSFILYENQDFCAINEVIEKIRDNFQQNLSDKIYTEGKD